MPLHWNGLKADDMNHTWYLFLERTSQWTNDRIQMICLSVSWLRIMALPTFLCLHYLHSSCVNGERHSSSVKLSLDKKNWFLLFVIVVFRAWLRSAVELCGRVAEGTGAGKRPNWPPMWGIRLIVSLLYQLQGSWREESMFWSGDRESWEEGVWAVFEEK